MKTENQNSSKTSVFFTFLAVFLLLIGVYATVRTAINVSAFKKYPTTGVLSIGVCGIAPYSQREEDCLYPQQYFTQDGKPRSATEEEKQFQKDQRRICISGVTETRRTTRINDISTSFLFLFLGGGLLLTKKYFT
jgi:hypothetical protein